MPLTIFSHRNDPDGVLSLIKEFAPFAVITTGESSWSAEMKFGGGLFKKAKILKVNFDRDWHEPPNWPTQIDGMQNYVSNFPIDEEVVGKVRDMIGSFQLSLGTINEPEIKDGDDPRLEVLDAIATHLDGIFFTPEALLDRNFLPLASADGESDSEARFPFIPVTPVATVSLDELPADDDEEDEPPLDPPKAESVAKQLLMLLVMAGRGLLDYNLAAGKTPAYTLEELRNWVLAIGLESELEPAELLRLDTPEGELPQQDTLDCVWRLEGLVVLAWALRLADLPRYDELVSTDELMSGLGFLDATRASELVEGAQLRSETELGIYNDQVFAFHWRMTDYRVKPQKIDFEKMKDECWFGPLDLSWADFIDQDLALEGTPISRIEPDQIRKFCSVASERHIASNWLQGHAAIYSNVDAST